MARKRVQEMLGEFLREAAVLVLVFGFLDQLLTEGQVTFGYCGGAGSIEGPPPAALDGVRTREKAPRRSDGRDLEFAELPLTMR